MSDPVPRRSRSRSPPPRAPRGNRGGFRWKDNRRNDDNRDRRDNDRRDFDRRPNYRKRSRSPDRDRRNDRNRDLDRDRPRSPRRREPEGSAGGSEPKDLKDGEKSGKKEKKEKKDKKPKAAAVAPGQELIVVNVNDRLGTKTAVPCLPSDTVGQLKLMIAARIGRDPGQIMLRRQGERPFKDMLSLEDYGISNGVQLDLEIDTGD